MNKEALLKQIKAKAKKDTLNRNDPRFLETMGFLVAKGFLKTNIQLLLLPNKRIKIDDAIWAGQNVEPRILEVLPAAVLRLNKHFDLDPAYHREIAIVVDQLRNHKNKGNDFCEVPYTKLKVWTELELTDKRVRTHSEKKKLKTFRLAPVVVACLKEIAQKQDCTEVDVIEKLILKAAK